MYQMVYYLNPETEKFESIPVPYMGLEAKKVLDYWIEKQKENGVQV
jgi:hypothetical protein